MGNDEAVLRELRRIRKSNESIARNLISCAIYLAAIAVFSYLMWQMMSEDA